MKLFFLFLLVSSQAHASRLLLEDVQKIQRNFDIQSYRAEECSTKLPWATNLLKNLNFKNYDQSEVAQNGENIISVLWQTHLDVRRPLAQYSPECIGLARDTFSAIRGVIDYVGTLNYITWSKAGERHLRGEKVEFQKRPIPILDKNHYHGYLSAPGYAGSPFKFQPGDLLVTRGFTAAPSALITQSIAQPAQYSHVVFVNIDSSGKPMTLESYAGFGVNKFDMDVALKNENPRIQIYRPLDSDLGKRSADFIYKKVIDSLSDPSKKINFDYYFDMEHHDKASCVELAQWAYDGGSDHKFKLPLYESVVKQKDMGFLNSYKLRNGPVFEASDLEVDPRFNLLVEFRDWELIRDSRYKDAIVHGIIDWQTENNYKFKMTQKAFAIKHVIYNIRKTPLWPYLRKIGVPDFAADAPPEILVSVFQVTQLTGILFNELQKADDAQLAQTGWPMTNAELKVALNDIRQRDETRAKAWGNSNSLFHWLYR